MDGNELSQALVGLEQPVNPGEHTFRAESGDARSKIAKVSIEEGGRKTVTLRLVSAAPPPPPPQVPVDNPEQPPQTSSSGSTLRTVGWIALGVGVIGGGVGTVYMLKKNADGSDADKLYKACNPRVCTAAERDRIDTLDAGASSAGLRSTAGFIVGGVGIVGGVTMIIVGSMGSDDAKPDAPSETASVQPWLGIGSAGLTGTF
jgi:hypothetical protein